MIYVHPSSTVTGRGSTVGGTSDLPPCAAFSMQAGCVVIVVVIVAVVAAAQAGPNVGQRQYCQVAQVLLVPMGLAHASCL